MAIPIDEFESHDPGHRTNAERVLDFLRANPRRAFKAVEIREATGVGEGSIHPVLGRLREDGVVRHKSPYWALADDEDGREWPPQRKRRGRRSHGQRSQG